MQEVIPLIPMVPMLTAQFRSGLPVLGGYSALHVPQFGPSSHMPGIGPPLPSLVLPPTMQRSDCSATHFAFAPGQS
eukprot:3874455-Amphidinium_carterae.1